MPELRHDDGAQVFEVDGGGSHGATASVRCGCAAVASDVAEDFGGDCIEGEDLLARPALATAPGMPQTTLVAPS